MPRTTLTITTESRNYTVQGDVHEIDTLFDRLVAETFKPVSADTCTAGIDYASGPDFTSDGETTTPNPSYERLRGRSAGPDRLIIHRTADTEGQHEVAIPLSPEMRQAVPPENEVAERKEDPVEEPTSTPPVQKEEPTTTKEPRKYKGFLMIKCEHCGKVKGFNSKMEIDTFRCECGAQTPLGELVPMTALCECGKHWRYLTNLTQDAYELNCIHCGSPIPVFWNDKKHKYETLIETLPREHKKGGKK